jgi:hypothetical protein
MMRLPPMLVVVHEFGDPDALIVGTTSTMLDRIWTSCDDISKVGRQHTFHKNSANSDFWCNRLS